MRMCQVRIFLRVDKCRADSEPLKITSSEPVAVAFFNKKSRIVFHTVNGWNVWIDQYDFSLYSSQEKERKYVFFDVDKDMIIDNANTCFSIVILLFLIKFSILSKKIMPTNLYEL